MKNKLIKNKGFFILFTIYITLFLTDIITTLLNGKLINVLEVNPLYQHVGIAGIVSLNVFIAIIIYCTYLYKKTNPTLRYILIQTMLVIIIARAWAIRNAIAWLRNPQTVEVAAQIATPAAKQATLQALAFIQYAPLILGIITFLFWKKDHKIEKK